MSTIVNALSTMRRPVVFEIFLALTQVFGFTMVILSGYFFNTNGKGIVWPKNGTISTSGDENSSNNLKNFHGFFMITGLVFFQGEALISYRMYRHEMKILSKFVHVVFHVLAIGFFTIALAVVIIQKNNLKQHHFTTVHSWIGLAVMATYLVQFSFGALNFLNPLIALKVKEAFMPYHRAIGVASFVACTIQAVIGHTEYIILAQDGDTFYGCYFSLNCKSKLEYIYNFSMISMICYCLTVLVVVIPLPWRREKTLDEMK